MLARISHTRLLRYAGLFTWAMVGLPMVYSWIGPLLGTGGDDELALRPMPWQGWIAYLAFGLSYAWLTRGLGSRARSVGDYVLLVVLTLAALAVSYFHGSGLGSVLLMVAACVLPWLLPLPLGAAWLLTSQLAVAPVFIRWLGFPPLEALMQSVLYAGLSGFVFITSLVALQQMQAREDQRRLNAELRATRALLAESSRVAERVRIARELHDLVGHHLTALTLNLEVASHLVGGVAHDKVRQAQSVAKLLLSDVREVVSQLRDDSDIDLGSALHTLVEGVPTPTVHLDLPDHFQIDDARRAHVLLRCAQETLTNTIRHARAENLWWRFNFDEVLGEIVFESRNDGVGVEGFSAGNGLNGMQERIREVGGNMQVNTAPGRGFSLRVWIPMEVK